MGVRFPLGALIYKMKEEKGFRTSFRNDMQTSNPETDHGVIQGALYRQLSLVYVFQKESE